LRRGANVVLHDVTLELRADECVSLIGPNGAGKTSLLLVLLGLLRPAAGRVRLDGHDLHRLPARQRGCFAAYVPQRADQLPAFTIYEIVAAARYPHVSPVRPLSDGDHRVVAGALARCGLESLARRPINSVSGGERQKALLAAAIAQDAQMMFLDEPTTALDPAYQLELAGLLRAWHAVGRGLVVVSHDLQLPAVLGGRVAALRAGRIVADGPAAEVLRADRLGEVYGAAFETLATSDGRHIVTPKWWSR